MVKQQYKKHILIGKCHQELFIKIEEIDHNINLYKTSTFLGLLIDNSFL